MFRFAAASLSPAVMLTAACLFGGGWSWAALIYMTLFVYLADRLIHHSLAELDADRTERAATRLNVLLALLHFGLLALGVWAVATPRLEGTEAVVTALALGLYFGQVSNSNAHELIHKPARGLRWLGKAVYVSLLFGHHASAHPRVHHVWAASDRDPNSARAGEGFYRFWPRAWIGSFRAGLRAENRLRARRAPPPPRWSHPYAAYGLGALATLALAWALAGAPGLWVLLALAGYAQMQLLLSDYVQHYGLRRARRPDGTLEPVGPQHAWNAPHWFSSAMLLNAPRHSDHHLNPLRAFPALRLSAREMPMLPHPFPLMAALALIPPVWRQVMDRRLAAWVAAPARGAAGGAVAGNLPTSGHAAAVADSPVPDSARPRRRPHPGRTADERGIL